ncbi:hypothetical protein [Pandoraea sp. NPDC087047]|uniref:hypothetical protein n=1 Tax=Pandoraea sp. NPDC087047 TaxID=3364390 RepID=UPI00380888BA
MAQIVLGLVVAVVLVRYQRSRETPLLPLDLMHVPVLTLSSLTSVACYMAPPSWRCCSIFMATAGRARRWFVPPYWLRWAAG